MRREFTAQAVGWIAGLAAAAITLYVMFGGGQGLGLPSGRYPVIFLIALAVGPPLIVGGIAGGAAFGIVYLLGAGVEKAADASRERAAALANEELAALVRRPVSPEAAPALLENEIVPVLRKLGVSIEEPKWPHGAWPLHLAAEAGNMALIEAIGERAPKTLTARRDGQIYFVDAAPEGSRSEALAAFVRGLARAIEKTMSAEDRPLTDEDRTAVADHLSKAMEQARPQASKGVMTVAIDVDRLKSWTICGAREARGVAAFNQGRYEQAIEPLSSAIRLDPDYANAFLVRGRAHAALGHREQAISDYTQAARLMPTSAEAVLRRGHVREEAGDLDGASADYEEALRIDPKYVDGYISRGAFKFNRRRNLVSGALADFRRALALDPGNQVATGNIAAVLKARGADEASLARVSEAIAADPQNPDLRANRGLILRLRGETGPALEDLDAALQERGFLFMHAGNHEHALADYRQLEQLLPDQAWIRSHAGFLRERLGQKDEAIASYQAAVKLDPNDPARADLARLGVPIPS